MNEISRQVQMARDIWETKGREKPSKVLLGKLQQAALVALAEEWGYFKKPDAMLAKTGESRVEFQGLKVYSVDDEDYCVCAP